MKSRRDLEDSLAWTLVQTPAAAHTLPAEFLSTMVITADSRSVIAMCLTEAAGRRSKPIRAPELSGCLGDAYRAWECRARGIGPMSAKRAATRIVDLHNRDEDVTALAAAIEEIRGGSPRSEVLGALGQRGGLTDGETRGVRDVCATLLTTIEEAKGGSEATHLKTGITEIDRLGILRWGDYPVVGARTGKGKTTLALNIARSVAKAGHGVLIHSAEMTAEEVVAKLVSEASAQDDGQGVEGVSVVDMFSREPVMDGPFSGRLSRGYQRVMDLPIKINSRRLSLHEIVAISRRAIRQGVRLVIIDYLQIIHHAPRGMQRREAVSDISHTLRRMALEEVGDGYGAVVMVISQLRRPPQGQEWREPTLYDLRESGDIENDATHIWLLHDCDDEQKPESPGMVKLIAAKQRLGASNTAVMLRKQLEYSRFTSGAVRYDSR